MSKDKDVQVTIRGLNKLTKAQARSRISWMKKTVALLDREVKGPWLVTRKQYAPVCSFSLMR